MPAAIVGVIGLTGTAAVIAELVISVALSYGLAKLQQSLAGKPKRQGSENGAPASRSFTVRNPVEPRSLIYGSPRVAGVIAGMFVGGAEKSVLFIIVAYAGHQSNDITEYNIDGVRVLSSQLGIAGFVSHPHFAASPYPSRLAILPYLGTSTQTASSISVLIEEWDDTHVGTGITYVVYALHANDTVWANGAPQNFFAVVEGRRCYDQRLDSTNGGSGSHRMDDATTWQYTNNWALAVQDYVTGGSITYDIATPDKRLAFGEDNSRIDWESFAAAATIADESVTVPAPVLAGTVTFTNSNDVVTGVGTDFTYTLVAGNYIRGADGTWREIDSITDDGELVLTSNYSGSTAANVSAQWNTSASNTTTQPRYTCDVALSCGDPHRDNLSTLLSAGIGHLSFSQGKYRLFAGAYDTPTVTLTQDDVHGPIAIDTHPDGEENYNMVTGTFFDPVRGWSQQNFASQTQSSYQTDDGGLQPRVIDLAATNDNYRVQRIANVHLLQSRNKTTVKFTKLRPRAVLISEWDTFNVTIPEFGWVSQVMRCIDWTFLPSGYIAITAKFDSAASYTDLDPADYQLPKNTATPAPAVQLPSEPTGLSITSFPTYAVVSVDGEFPAGSIIEVWEHTSSTPFSSATLIDQSSDRLIFTVPRRDTTTRYYWATSRLNGQRSSNYPASTGVSGAADLAQTTDLEEESATEVLTDTDTGISITAVTSEPDAYGYNTVLASITYTPPVDCTVILTAQSSVSYSTGATYFDAAVQTVFAVDEVLVPYSNSDFYESFSAATLKSYRVANSTRIDVSGGSAIKFEWVASKARSDHTATADAISLRLEAIKR